MGREVVLTLNDGLYNAGIRGFLRVCQFGNLAVKKDGNQILFNSDILQKFTIIYLKTLIEVFRDDTVYKEIIAKYARIRASQDIKENEKNVHDQFKYVIDKLERASYKAGYTIVQSRGETFDFIAAIKNCKKEKDLVLKISILETIINKLQEYENVFLLKDITYTKIQPFWTNVAFLNSNENKNEFATSFDKSFGIPVNEFMLKTEKKAKLHCCQCEVGLNKKDAAGMGWINDVGVDIARKTSYYWNFQVDSFLCPMCNLIYACIPLGFTMKGSEGIFINDNEGISELLAMNKTPSAKFIATREDLYYHVMDQFRQQNQYTMAEKEVENIQIIRRSDRKYVFNILSKEKLTVLKKCNTDLEKLVGISFRLQEDYINVYQVVINAILAGTNLYMLIHSVLQQGVSNRVPTRFVGYLVKIQTVAFSRGDGKVKEKAVFPIMKLGENLRIAMTADNQNESKVRTLSYKLLNALKVRNSAEFMDTILRNYIGLGKLIPNGFLDVLRDDEKFLDFGYAFVTGLNGGNNKLQEEKEETKK